MESRVVLWLMVLQVVCGSEQVARDGLIDHISNGMKFAKDFLGTESVAMKVAEFVVRAFQTANKPNSIRRRPPFNEAFDSSLEETKESYEKRPDNYEKRPDGFEKRPDVFEKRPDSFDKRPEAQEPNLMSPIRHLVRLFGLQPNQISAVAVNALVFVAQMISTFLVNPKRPGRPHRSEDTTTWLLNKNSRRLQDLLATARNETLSDAIDDLIRDQGSDEETSCIRLLVCKITPFIYRMQKAVFGKDERADEDDKEIRGSAVFYKHLPTKEEVDSRSEVCEKKYRECDLNE